MEIRVSKHDVLWNYIAQFFNLGANLIVLPVILHMLSSEEIGMNYLMLSVSSLVALADFGFSSQFGRNITYVFSGAQELKKEGMSGQSKGPVNYHLLARVIETAKYIYKRISVLALIAMLSLGTLYMYNATDGFTTVYNALWIWILFSVSTYFNMYFMYYNSLLTGAAMIMESKQATILNKITYIAISFALLFMGFGLLSIVIANFIAPFIGRWFSHRKFYNKEIKQQLVKEKTDKEEIRETFSVLWYNAKRLGINFLGSYGIQQSGTFIIGIFLPLSEVASYGLMCQLFQFVASLSLGVFTSMLPSFYKDRVEGNKDKLIRDFCFSSFVFIVGFSFLSAIIFIGGEFLLTVIGSATVLPSLMIMTIYFVHLFLENFHSICATMIVTNNQVPFVKASLISGVFIIISNLATLKFTTLGLLGVVLGQMIVQSCYNHWKWPLWIFDELKITPVTMLKTGGEEVFKQIRRL